MSEQERRHTTRGGKLQVRKRTGKKGHTISGYAAVFNSPADIGGQFVEEIAPGAFRDALATSDVRGLFNHDSNFLLGRLGSGTLRAHEDSTGLFYELDLPESRSDVLEAIQRGDITGNSFSFTVDKEGEKWSSRDGKSHRVIHSIRAVHDLGPVTFPAYEATTVSARTQAQAKRSHPPRKPRPRLEAAKRELAAIKERDRIREAHRRRRAQLQALAIPVMPRKKPTARSRLDAVRKYPEQAERIAYHEAGHAVVSYLQGNGVGSVCINPPKPSGKLGGGTFLRARGDRSPLVAAAGEAAEILHGSKGVPDWDGSGKGDFRFLLKEYGSVLRARDEGWFQVTAAKERMKPAWAAVRSVAGQLLAKGVLSGPECEELISAALPPFLWRQAEVQLGNAKSRAVARQRAA